MNIYEAIGMGLVIYLTVAGVFAHAWLIIRGREYMKWVIQMGAMHSFEANKNYVETLWPERHP